MGFTIKCRCGWEYPTYATEEEAKVVAEKELGTLIKFAIRTGEASDAVKERHIYEIVPTPSDVRPLPTFPNGLKRPQAT